MPRLSDPRITKGHAVSLLVHLYLEEPNFVAELQDLRQRHHKLFEEYILGLVELLARCEVTMTPDEYRKTVGEFREAAVTPSRVLNPPSVLANLFEEIGDISLKAGPYFHDLERLAFKWKLRAPWAGPMLNLHNIHDYLKQYGMPDIIDVSLQEMDFLYPWPPPLPPLEIKVSSWAFFLYGRTQIQSEIAVQLKDYEDRLKALDYEENPSRLQTHAKWWFECFIRGEEYDDIAQEEAYTPGGSLVSYARNVGNAVRKFSRLVGIDIKDLKSDS